MKIWLVIDEDREGEMSSSAHRTRAGAIAQGRIAIEQYAQSSRVRPESIAAALQEFDEGDDGKGDTGGGDPDARFYVTVHSSYLLD